MPSEAYPYETEDVALAAILAMLGCDFPRNAAGLPKPCQNIYTREHLLKWGFGQAGGSAWDAAQKAWAAQKIGRVVYCFQRTERLDKLRDTYTKTEKTIASTSDMARVPIGAVDDDILRICCQFRQTLKALDQAKYKVVPELELSSATARSLGNDRTEVRGSFRRLSLNADAETRQHFGF